MDRGDDDVDLLTCDLLFCVATKNQRRLADALISSLQGAGVTLEHRVHEVPGPLPACPRLLIAFHDQLDALRDAIEEARGCGAAVWLVQDGFLSFELPSLVPRSLWRIAARLPIERPSRLRGPLSTIFYKRIMFGASRAQRVFVEGPRMKRRLIEQYGYEPEDVRCIGPLVPEDEASGEAKVPPERERILVIDQCMQEHHRLFPRRTLRGVDTWSEGYRRLAAELEGLDVELRFHPGTSEVSRKRLRDIFPPTTSFAAPEEEGLEQSLARCTRVVVFASTVFRKALTAGRPTYVWPFPYLLDRLPSLSHPLLFHTRGGGDLRRRLQAPLSESRGSARGTTPWREIFSAEDDPWGTLAGEVSAFLAPQSDEGPSAD